MPTTQITLNVSNDQLSLLRTLLEELAASADNIEVDPASPHAIKLPRIKVTPQGQCDARVMGDTIRDVIEELSRALGGRDLPPIGEVSPLE